MYRSNDRETWGDLLQRTYGEQDPFKLVALLLQMAAAAHRATRQEKEELQRSMEPIIRRHQEFLRAKQ